jgi:hypothetical protein
VSELLVVADTPSIVTYTCLNSLPQDGGSLNITVAEPTPEVVEEGEFEPQPTAKIRATRMVILTTEKRRSRQIMHILLTKKPV